MGKKVLGLDIGTNSIGWALLSCTETVDNSSLTPREIIDLGSRIIPMDGAALSDFDNGNLQSQTAERTRLRATRRLHERHLLRRERLHRVLYMLGFLPEHYANYIDFDYPVALYRSRCISSHKCTKSKANHNGLLEEAIKIKIISICIR